jgi:hypothetical protein
MRAAGLSKQLSGAPTIISLHRRQAEYANIPHPATNNNAMTIGLMPVTLSRTVTQSEPGAAATGHPLHAQRGERIMPMTVYWLIRATA